MKLTVEAKQGVGGNFLPESCIFCRIPRSGRVLKILLRCILVLCTVVVWCLLSRPQCNSKKFQLCQEARPAVLLSLSRRRNKRRQGASDQLVCSSEDAWNSALAVQACGWLQKFMSLLCCVSAAIPRCDRLCRELQEWPWRLHGCHHGGTRCMCHLTLYFPFYHSNIITRLSEKWGYYFIWN